jgi:hypothetical protein
MDSFSVNGDLPDAVITLVIEGGSVVTDDLPEQASE